MAPPPGHSTETSPALSLLGHVCCPLPTLWLGGHRYAWQRPKAVCLGVRLWEEAALRKERVYMHMCVCVPVCMCMKHA